MHERVAGKKDAGSRLVPCKDEQGCQQQDDQDDDPIVYD
jgi:hypothetical protein